MAITNSDSNSYSYVSTVTYQPNIYERINKMAETIGDIKTELAIEKKLLNIEKIRNSYVQQNTEIEALSNHSFRPYEGNWSPQTVYYPRESQSYPQNPYYFIQDRASLFSDVISSNSEREAIENRRKMQQLAIHNQLSNIEKQFKMEKHLVQQNMNTLCRVSEMVFPKNARKRRGHDHREEN